MKKWIALLLAGMMCVALAAPAFAADNVVTLDKQTLTLYGEDENSYVKFTFDSAAVLKTQFKMEDWTEKGEETSSMSEVLCFLVNIDAPMTVVDQNGKAAGALCTVYMPGLYGGEAFKDVYQHMPTWNGVTSKDGVAQILWDANDPSDKNAVWQNVDKNALYSVGFTSEGLEIMLVFFSLSEDAVKEETEKAEETPAAPKTSSGPVFSGPIESELVDSCEEVWAPVTEWVSEEAWIEENAWVSEKEWAENDCWHVEEDNWF